MGTGKDELEIIKKTLSDHTSGMTVTEISRTINMSRNSVAKYLEMLAVSGQVEMKMFGPSKVFYLSQRVPISTMFGLSSDLFVTLDKDLKVSQANAKFLDLIGTTLDLLRKRPIPASRVPILSDVEFVSHFKDALNGKEYAQEICVRKGSNDLYFNAKIIPTVFDDGNRGVAVVMEDVTTRKQAELKLKRAHDSLEKKVAERTAALEDAREFTRAVIDSLKITHLAVLDNEGNIIDVNEAWKKFARENSPDGPANVGPGTNYFKVCERAVRDGDTTAMQAAEGIRSVMSGASPIFELDYPCHSPDEKRWFTMRVMPLSGSKVNGVVVTHVNITDRKLAEDMVASSRDYYHRLFDTLPSYVWQTDREGKCSYVNQSWREFTGRALEQEADSGWLDDIHPDDREAFVRAYEYAFASRVPFELFYRMRNRESKYCWVVNTGRPFEGLNGQFEGFLGACYDITYRKLAEDRLRESENQYRSLFNTMSEGFALHEIICDEAGVPVDFIFLDLNPAFERLTGINKADAIGRTVREVLPGIEPFWIETNGKVALTGEPARFENYAAPLDRWYEVFAYRPEPGKFATIFTDIMERRHAMEALEKYQLFSDNTRDIVLFVQGDGHILDANVAATKAYGYSADEIRKLRIHDLRTDTAQSQIEEQIETAYEQGILLETVHRRKDGTTFPVEVSSRGKLIAGQKILLSIVRDITRRKRAEAAMRESTEIFQRIFEESPLGSIITSMHYRYLQINEQMTRITGYSKEELLDMTYEQLTHPDDRAMTAEYARKLVDGLLEHVYYEKRYIRKDGTIIWVHISLGVINDDSGKPRYFIGTVEDITGRRKTESALKVDHGEAQDGKTEDGLAEGERKFRKVVENSTEGIIIIDEDGRIAVCNRAAAEILGYDERHVVGRVSWDFIFMLGNDENKTGHKYDRIKTGIQQYLKTGVSPVKQRYREEEVARADGTRRVIRITDFPIQTARGFMIVTIVSDITERRKAEDALRGSLYNAEKALWASQSILQEIAESEGLLSVTLDNDGQATDCSETFLKATGWTRDEVIGKAWLETFIDPADARSARDAMNDTDTGSGKARKYVVAHIVTRTDERLKASWHSFLLKDISDRLTGIVCLGKLAGDNHGKV